MVVLDTRVPLVPLIPERVDERDARRTLREQVARLERELATLFVDGWPREGIDFSVASQGGPRLLSLGELEWLRDALAERVARVRQALGERYEREAASRILIERMMLQPARYKWVMVQNGDIGEPGCKQYHVVPRLGVVGMLMGWWRVKISSGCPLAWGRRPPAAAP